MSRNKNGKRLTESKTIHTNAVDNLANGLKEVLLSTAEKVLGRQRKKIQPCVTNEVLDLCDKRRHLKQQNYTNNEVS